jgi:hypothetical protein
VQGAGAHELRDVLLMAAFGAMDQRAERHPERETRSGGRGDEGREELQQ